MPTLRCAHFVCFIDAPNRNFIRAQRPILPVAANFLQYRGLKLQKSYAVAERATATTHPIQRTCQQAKQNAATTVSSVPRLRRAIAVIEERHAHATPPATGGFVST